MHYIFHIDANAFFASVEALIDPKLKNVPFAVGGRTSRSVVASANYLARSYGVKAGMPIFQAKKVCPKILFVPAHFELYEEYSQKMFNVIKQRVTNRIEQFSIDECYVDGTNLCKSEKDALKLAKSMQQMILDETGLGVSVGASYNKFLAKMASDMKKPLGITSIFSAEDIQNRIWPLPIKDMLYLGKASCEELGKYGIKTIRDVANPKNNEILKNVLNKNWYLHFLHANGIDPDPVNTLANQPKSISASNTFLNNTRDYEEITKMIKSLVDEISRKLQGDNLEGKTISIIVKYPDFKSVTKSISTNKYYSTYEEILTVVLNLYDLYFANQEIRLIGAGISNLVPKQEYMGGLVDPYTKKKIQPNQLDKVIKDINDHFEIDIIDYALKRMK